MHYIPEQDPVQDALKKSMKTTYFKLTLPDTGNKLKVAIWTSGTPKQFLLHVCTVIHMCKQMGLDTNFTNAKKEVTTAERYEWRSSVWQLKGDFHPEIAASELPYHVVAYDFGVKLNILRMLVARGCRVTVVPAKTPASEVLALNQDGVFLSNGPGDPEPCDYAIQAIKEVLETEIPVFGICLGHQLLALASGAKTVKMGHGHHGANHPVQDLKTGVVMITSQNHGFAVEESSLPANLRATHKSLFDGTLQGIERTDKEAFSFQGHPEASPGPHDVAPLFDRFIEAMAKRR